MPISINNKPPVGSTADSVMNEEAFRKLQEMLHNASPEKLKELFLDKKKSKPTRWSSRTVAPYYKERFALELKVVIDLMMTQFAEGLRRDQEWKYKDFPGYSYNTIYNRVNQSKAYLLDYMDINGIYASFFELISITREKTGVRLSYNNDVRNPGEDFMPSPVIPTVETPKWKQKIEDFIASSKDGESLTIKNLSLTQEQIQEQETILCQTKGILAEVTDDRIKIKRIPVEQWERLQ